MILQRIDGATLSRNRLTSNWWYVLGFGTLFLGLRWYFVAWYGSATPFWDQWDAEATKLYLPWMEGHLGFRHFFEQHNEHRILTTRVLLLGLFVLNGNEWDTLLQMQINAVIHGSALALLLVGLGQGLSPWQKFTLWGIGFLTFLPPYAHQSVLEGIQSAYYFFLLFSVIFIYLISRFPVNRPIWWIGLLCGLLSFFSLASGAVALMAGFLVMVARQLSHKEHKNDRRVQGWFAAFFLLVLALICVAATPSLPGHAGMRAQSPFQFFTALISLFSWPGKGYWWEALMFHSPMLVFAVQMWRHPNLRHTQHFFLLGIGLWLMGTVTALAMSRATGINASRYIDLFVVSLPLNVVAWFWVCSTLTPKSKRWWYVLAAFWLVSVMYGKNRELPKIATGMQYRYDTAQIQERNVRAYLCTRDARYLHDPVPQHLPYPDRARLATLLNSPSIQAILPEHLLNPAAEPPIGVPGDPFCDAPFPTH